MILLLDTSSPVCRLTLIDGDRRYDDEWQAGRTLAKHLLRYLQQQLDKNDATFASLRGIGVLAGPGSFTGLRIGLTVLNTIAESGQIPIVGVRGEQWQKIALERLKNGENDAVVLPFYGSEAHITKPRK